MRQVRKFSLGVNLAAHKRYLQSFEKVQAPCPSPDTLIPDLRPCPPPRGGLKSLQFPNPGSLREDAGLDKFR